MRRRILFPIATLILLPIALITQAAEQRVYQWTDSQGVVHYSQLEPDKTKAQARDLHTTSDPTPPPPKTPEQTACDVATANQAILASGKQVPLSKDDKDGDGKPDPMSADEIRAAKDLAASQVQHFCNESPSPSQSPSQSQN